VGNTETDREDPIKENLGEILQVQISFLLVGLAVLQIGPKAFCDQKWLIIGLLGVTTFAAFAALRTIWALSVDRPEPDGSLKVIGRYEIAASLALLVIGTNTLNIFIIGIYGFQLCTISA